MDEKERNEIAYKLLKRIVRTFLVTVGDLNSEIGKIASDQATGLTREQLRSFAKVIFEDILKEELHQAPPTG